MNWILRYSSATNRFKIKFSTPYSHSKWMRSEGQFARGVRDDLALKNVSENDWKSQSTKREALFASKICAYSFSVGHFLMDIDFSNLFLSFIPSFSIIFLYINIYYIVDLPVLNFVCLQIIAWWLVLIRWSMPSALRYYLYPAHHF